jgi:hypothetical protein
MDLETNAIKGLAREHSLMLQRGTTPENSNVKSARTFRSGLRRNLVKTRHQQHRDH